MAPCAGHRAPVLAPLGVTFLGRRIPTCFDHRTVTIPSGCHHAYARDDWHDSIVVVEAGEVELEAADGERHRFGRGSLVWFDGIALRSIRNDAAEDAVLVAIARRPASQR